MNYDVNYLQNDKYEIVVFKSNNDLSWDLSYSYFISNKWTIGNLNGLNNCWFKKLPKNKNKTETKIPYNPLNTNVIDWTPLRLKRLKYLIGCETDKEVIMESFSVKSYDQIKIGMNLLGINRKKISIEKHRKLINYEPSVN